MPVKIVSPVVSPTPVAPVLSQGIKPQPQPGNNLFNHAVARTLFGLSMPINNREYLYYIPTSMMDGLHTNMPTFSDNAMATGPPYNPHNASSSAIYNMV